EMSPVVSPARRSNVGRLTCRRRSDLGRLDCRRCARPECSHHGVCKPDALQRAFTLIELLIVCGLISALVGIAALALGGRGGEGVALANAQSTVAALAGAARTQAVLNQTSTRLIIYATLPPTGDAAKYLRS